MGIYLSVHPLHLLPRRLGGTEDGKGGFVCRYESFRHTDRQPLFLLYGYFHVPGIALTAFYCLEWSSYTLINLPPPLPHLVTWGSIFQRIFISTSTWNFGNFMQISALLKLFILIGFIVVCNIVVLYLQPYHPICCILLIRQDLACF